VALFRLFPLSRLRTSPIGCVLRNPIFSSRAFISKYASCRGFWKHPLGPVDFSCRRQSVSFLSQTTSLVTIMVVVTHMFDLSAFILFLPAVLMFRPKIYIVVPKGKRAVLFFSPTFSFSARQDYSQSIYARFFDARALLNYLLFFAVLYGIFYLSGSENISLFSFPLFFLRFFSITLSFYPPPSSVNLSSSPSVPPAFSSGSRTHHRSVFLFFT